MPNNTIKKQYAVGILCIVLALPFVLQRSFYPFMRFGMFAEPVTDSIQTEQFFVQVGQRSRPTTFTRFNPAEIGIYPATFDYWLRNYYYRQQGPLLLQQLQASTGTAGVWQLVRVVPPDSAVVVSRQLP